MKQTGRMLTMLTTCIWFLGCASFKGHDLPEVGTLLPPKQNVARQNASYEFSSETELVKKRPHHEEARAKLEAEFVDVLHESGYFGILKNGSYENDLKITIHLVNSANPAAMLPAFITGYSLYTIPSWAKDTFEVVCNVQAADGREYEYTLEDSSIIVQWLPMILAFPFNMPLRVPVDVRKNIYRNLIKKMKDDGIFSKFDPLNRTSKLVVTFEVAFL